MSNISKGILGAIAISLSLGAAFASGSDLLGTSPALAGTSDAAINRAAKTDRGSRVAAPAVPTRTISLRLESLADTSILIRLPVEARSRPVAPSLTKPGRMTEACEPVVSVLTDIVKRLQPGRCVT